MTGCKEHALRDDQDRLLGVTEVPLQSCARSRFGCLLLVILGAAVVLSVAVWRVRTVTDVRIRTSTREQFTPIAMGLVSCDEVDRHLPYSSYVDPFSPANEPIEPDASKHDRRPLYSWRYRMWPYLQSWPGAWDPSKAWDDPANRQLNELSGF
jgi:hypothetical protein